jgi:hypothetical protein
MFLTILAIAMQMSLPDSEQGEALGRWLADTASSNECGVLADQNEPLDKVLEW